MQMLQGSKASPPVLWGFDSWDKQSAEVACTSAPTTPKTTSPKEEVEEMPPKGARGSAEKSFTTDAMLIIFENHIPNQVWEEAMNNGILFGMNGAIQINFKKHEAALAKSTEE